MFRNYLITALRNLVRNRLYASISICGLAIGLAAVFLIALFVRDDLSYDRFFPDYRNIYLLGMEASLPGRARLYRDSTPAELAPLLRADFPSAVVARIWPQSVVVRHGDIENNERVQWADANIFDIFKFKVVAGTLANALTEPNSVVLTREMARKYFGTADPIGEALELGFGADDGTPGSDRKAFKKRLFSVTAVIEDLPSDTEMEVDILLAGVTADSPIARIDANPPGQDGFTIDSLTYLKVPGSATAREIRNGLPAFLKRHKSRLFALPYLTPLLRPIASLHLAPGVAPSRGHIQTIYAMVALGALILLAAGINFVNLMTARATRRAVEVGVRKTNGAARRHLIAQFMGEAMVYVAIAVAIATVLAWVLLPSLNSFLDRTIELGLLTDIRSVGFLLGISVLVGVLAGAYPALALSAFHPATVLRAVTLQLSGASLVRQCLVVLQFALLIGLLIATGVVYRQTHFALTEARRLDTDQVILVTDAPCRGAFKDEVADIPGVRGVACSSGSPLGMAVSLGQVKAVDGSYISLDTHSVGYGFLEFYGLKPLAGRFFSKDHPGDAMPEDPQASTRGAVVLNEAAVRRLGFTSAAQAIGKSTSLDPQKGVASEIIGVVPDFALDAVQKAVPPIVYFVYPGLQDIISVRIDGDRAPEALAAIDRLWTQAGSPRPITRSFLDQRVTALYADIVRQETLLAVFSGVALSIAILGLIGMSASMSELRTKEIGVRKAMGASRGDVVRLLLWQFARPVVLANLIAWPIGYCLMQQWLNGFARHIALGPWLFLTPSVAAIVIATVTVWRQALVVANTRAVTALRYE